MAAPFVAGAFALLKSQSPELTAPQIAQIMFDTATDLGARGVDSVYGQGLVNVGEAILPQGQLVIYQSDSTLGPNTRLADSGIVASSAMSTAMASILDGRELMVGDRYTRGFFLDADAILATNAAQMPSTAGLQEVKIANGLSVLSSATGLGVHFEGSDHSYTLGTGNLESDALSPLSTVTSDMSASYTVKVSGSVSLVADLSGASGDFSNSASSIGLQVDGMNGSTFTTKIGVLNEKGSVLGSRFYGAAGQSGSARTSFLQVNGRLGLSANSFLEVSGTHSTTDFTQQGMVTTGTDLNGSAGKIAIGQKGACGLNGTVTASISAPLQVTSGTIGISMPTARTASDGGVESTGVTRETESVDFHTESRPYDLSVSYVAKEGATGTDMEFNAGYRVHGSNSHPFVGLGVTKRF